MVEVMDEMKVAVEFVSTEPEQRGSYDHRAVAEELASRPGSWAVVDLPVYYASTIRRGALTAYPEGMFEVAVRSGKLQMCFVGDPEEFDAVVSASATSGGGRVYDHDAARQKAREEGSVWLPDWPKSYVTLIRKGKLGYAAGQWQARYVKDFGLGLTWLG